MILCSQRNAIQNVEVYGRVIWSCLFFHVVITAIYLRVHKKCDIMHYFR